MKVGDPADPATMLGPVIRAERRTRDRGVHRRRARRDGATLATGGGRPAGPARGWFLEPTVFCDVRNDIRIAREEIFGPVVSVIPFRDDDEAVRIANDSTYGLGGAIYSQRHVARHRAREAASAPAWCGSTTASTCSTRPFGGFKESGIGREGGRWGMEEYTEVQQITWRA